MGPNERVTWLKAMFLKKMSFVGPCCSKTGQGPAA